MHHQGAKTPPETARSTSLYDCAVFRILKNEKEEEGGVRDFLNFKNFWKSRKIQKHLSCDRALDDLAAELEVVRRDDLHDLVFSHE